MLKAGPTLGTHGSAFSESSGWAHENRVHPISLIMKREACRLVQRDGSVGPSCAGA